MLNSRIRTELKLTEPTRRDIDFVVSVHPFAIIPLIFAIGPGRAISIAASDQHHLIMTAPCVRIERVKRSANVTVSKFHLITPLILISQEHRPCFQPPRVEGEFCGHVARDPRATMLEEFRLSRVNLHDFA